MIEIHTLIINYGLFFFPHHAFSIIWDFLGPRRKGGMNARLKKKLPGFGIRTYDL